MCPKLKKKKKKKKKKDFRGEGQLNESIDLFFPHPTLVGRYTTKKNSSNSQRCDEQSKCSFADAATSKTARRTRKLSGRGSELEVHRQNTTEYRERPLPLVEMRAADDACEFKNHPLPRNAEAFICRSVRRFVRRSVTLVYFFGSTLGT